MSHPNLPLLILDLIASNPFLTVRGAEAKLNVAYNTVMRAIAKLQELGVLSQVTQAKRDRVFCARGILDILEEPPHLNPSERL